MDTPTTSTSSSSRNMKNDDDNNNNAAPSALVPRHSGRVYVRGRIRRIWRPRYIELMDDGTLRYYEETIGISSATITNTPIPQRHIGGTTTTTSSTSGPSNHHEYKYTLMVTGARILDVTTIRDLHTGLPRGTFGFVVRGQRHFLSPPLPVVQSPQPPTVTNQPIAASSSHDGMTDSFVFAEEEEEVQRGGLLPGTQDTSSAAVEAAAAAAAAIVPIRDYLCAVPTLEEAQMWVVALQWAASIRTPHSDEEPSKLQPGSVSATSSIPNISLPTPVVDHHWWKVDYTNTGASSTGNTAPSTALAASTTQNVEPIPTTTPKSTISKLSSDAGNDVKTTAARVESGTTTTVAAAGGGSGDKMRNEMNGGKVLVTAVTGYSVVRYTTWTLEIVYHIHAMLLYNDTTATTTSSTDNEGNVPVTQQQQRCVEHWSLQRTAGQFQTVATELFLHQNNDTASTLKGTRSNDDGDDTHKNSNADWNVLRRLPTWSSRPTLAEVDQSLSIVDSVLRSWILSPQLVNADVLKQFLGLGSIDNKKVNNSSSSSSYYESVGAALFQSFFRNVHCMNPLAIRNKSISTVPSHITSDVYVREWLQSIRRTGIQHRTTNVGSVADTKHSKNSGTTIGLLSSLFKTKPANTNISQIAIQLHHHQYHERNMLYFAGAAVAVIGMIPSVIPLWRYVMPVIQIRFDYLLASWVGATYLGHRIGLASKSLRTDLGGTSNNPRHGVTMFSRHKKFAATAAAPSSSSISLKSITTSTVDPQNAQQVPDSPKAASSSDNSVVMVTDYVDAVHSSDMDDFADFNPTATEAFFQDRHQQNITDDDNEDDESDGEATTLASDDMLQRPASDKFLSALSNDKNGLNTDDYLSSPLPKYPNNNGSSCWSQPSYDIFHVRGATYLRDKIKVCSGPSPLTCRGVDVWITDNPERHIARHPSILGGQLNDVDTFLVNFLLPFGNLVAYFEIPPLSSFPSKLRTVWTKFLKGDQQYRDARLKLLPVVVDGPWIVKTAVGPGKSPALLGKAIPLQYFFRDPDGRNKKGVYEVDVIITASTIAKGILSVVKSQTKAVSIAFAFIIEAVDQSELPETVLCSFQVHSLHLEECPSLPPCNLD